MIKNDGVYYLTNCDSICILTNVKIDKIGETWYLHCYFESDFFEYIFAIIPSDTNFSNYIYIGEL